MPQVLELCGIVKIIWGKAHGFRYMVRDIGITGDITKEFPVEDGFCLQGIFLGLLCQKLFRFFIFMDCGSVFPVYLRELDTCLSADSFVFKLQQPQSGQFVIQGDSQIEQGIPVELPDLLIFFSDGP